MSLLVVRVPIDEVDMASDWLWSLGTQAVEERPAPEGDDGLAQLTLIAGFDDEDLALAARSVLGERWPTRFEQPADDADWRDVWLKHLEPVQVAGFWIHPPWQVSPTDDLQRSISIDPGRAFGSGHHVSTQLAIEALADAVRPGDRVLDVGCGTGILAIAAKKLGARHVLGFDLDDDIIELARSNAEANHLQPGVTFTSANAERVAAEIADHEFDVVIANMTVGTIEPLFTNVDRWWSRTLIMSGLLVNQGDRLLKQSRGTTHRTQVRDGWCCLTVDR